MVGGDDIAQQGEDARHLLALEERSIPVLHVSSASWWTRNLGRQSSVLAQACGRTSRLPTAVLGEGWIAVRGSDGEARACRVAGEIEVTKPGATEH